MKRTASETLRAVADLIDAHPDLPLPPFVSVYDHRPDTADLRWYLHINGKGGETEQRRLLQQIVGALGGKWAKEYQPSEAMLTQERDGLNMQVVVERSAVCARRVVGTETVTLPAVEAQPERTVEREVVEWDCEPLLADAGTAGA